MEPLRIVDFNSMFSFSGGGIRTYHMRKLAYFAGRADVAYSMIAPSDHDGVEEHGHARLYHVKTPSLLRVRNYSIVIEPRKLLRLVDELQPDLIEAGAPYTDPLLARLIARQARRAPGAGAGPGAVIVGFWHTHYPSAYLEFYGSRVSPGFGRALGRLGWKLARRTYGFFDATIAAADCIIEDLREAGISRVIQCPLGIDIEAFHPRHRDAGKRRQVGAEGDGKERPVVFFPHRLLAEKGIVQVVEAVPRIAEATNAVFVFAGTGPEQPRVEALCREREDCHFLGFVDGPGEMARWHASADVTFGLSAWETFGFSVLEAMASGVPLVAADRGAARDWVGRAGCGVLVPHGDTEALVRATIELLQRPDRAELGAAGRAFVAAHFSWEQTFERMLHYYRRLVEARRAGEQLAGFPFLLDTGGAAETARAARE
jgi:alpha-1,6-mannosyltransferase